MRQSTKKLSGGGTANSALPSVVHDSWDQFEALVVSTGVSQEVDDIRHGKAHLAIILVQQLAEFLVLRKIGIQDKITRLNSVSLSISF